MTKKYLVIAGVSALFVLGGTSVIACSNPINTQSARPVIRGNPTSSVIRERINGYPVMRTHGDIISVDNVNELMERSDIIVIGKTSKSITEGIATLPRDSDGDIYSPYTEVPFKVNKVFKGDKGLKEIRLGQEAALIQEPNKPSYVRIFGDYVPVEPNTKYLMFLKKGMPGSGAEDLYFPVGIIFGQHNLVSDNEETRYPNATFRQIRKLVRQQFKE
jgi:hypothetical protein